MNLETKITIYKFTPQVFTLTQKCSSGQCTISMVTSQFGEHLTTAFA